MASMVLAMRAVLLATSMEPSTVLLVGSHSADRSAALELLLRDLIESRGWSERLRLVVAGLGEGAGELSADGFRVLSEEGLGEPLRTCADLDRHTELLHEAETLVVATDEDAEMVVELDGAEGKQVVSLPEVLPEAAVALEDPDTDLDAYVAELRPVMSVVLSRLITAD